MARRSKENEIAKALADMPKWRRKTVRSLLGYGIVAALLGIVSLAMPWIYWHKIVYYFPTDPFKALELLLGPIALGGFLFFALLPMIWKIVREMLHSARQEELRCLMESERVMLP